MSDLTPLSYDMSGLTQLSYDMSGLTQLSMDLDDWPSKIPREAILCQPDLWLTSFIDTQQIAPSPTDNVIDFAQYRERQMAVSGSTTELNAPANAGAGAQNA
jgi:hypothetical protein